MKLHYFKLKTVTRTYKCWLEELKGRHHMGDSRRWKDNIKINRKEIYYDSGNWICLGQVMIQWLDLVNTVMNLGVL